MSDIRTPGFRSPRLVTSLPLALLTAGILVLGGCSSSDGDGGGGDLPDGGDDGGAPCTMDTDCEAGFRCIVETGMCVEERCQAGGCPDGTECNVETGVCEEVIIPEVCEGVMCAEHEICDAETGECIPDVSITCGGVTCGEGEICDRTDNQCRPENCVGVQCPRGQECEPADGSCVGAALCNAPGLCPEGSACDPLLGQCVEGECGVDADCSDGTYCDVATHFCKFDRCGGVICGDDEHCLPASGECTANVDNICDDVACADGFLCNAITGLCDPIACNLLTQRCGAGKKCDFTPEGPRCVEAVGGGATGDDCDLTATGSDCAEGNLCAAFGGINNTCRQVCDAVSGDGCRPELVCTVVEQLDPVGTCEGAVGCDLFAPECPRYLACYWLGETSVGCFRPGQIRPGAACRGPLACRPGHTCVQVDMETSACLPHCRTDGLEPGCPDGLVCAGLQGAPPPIGVCVPDPMAGMQ